MGTPAAIEIYTSIILPTTMSPTSPLYLWREMGSKGAQEEGKNPPLFVVVLKRHVYYLKYNTHLHTFTCTQTFVYLDLSGLTQMSLFTLSTTPATDARSFPSAAYVPWPLE